MAYPLRHGGLGGFYPPNAAVLRGLVDVCSGFAALSESSASRTGCGPEKFPDSMGAAGLFLALGAVSFSIGRRFAFPDQSETL